MADTAKLTVRIGANIKEFEKKMQQIQGKMEGIGKKLQKAGAGLTAGVTVPILALGTAAFSAADDFDKAYNNIRVGTGAVGDDLEKLKDSFKNVFNEVPQDADTVSNALAGLNTMTGATGKELEELTKAALDASRMLGEDGVENANKFGNVMKQWNVPVEDGTELMDVFFKATQDYGVGLNTLMGHMTKFGPVLQNAGFTAEESADLFGRLEKEGIQVTRVMPGLNAAFRNWASEGKDSREEFDKVITKMQEAETETEALAMATEIFGAEGAQRLTTAIRNGAIPSLDELGTALEDSSGLVDDTGQDTLTLGERFEIMKGKIQTAIEPLGNTLMNILEDLEPAFERVIGVVQRVGEWFDNLGPTGKTLTVAFGAIAAAVGPLLVVFGTLMTNITTLMPVFKGLVGALTVLTSPVGLVVAGIAALGAGFVLAYNKSETFRNFIDGIGERFRDAMSWIGDFKDGIIGLFQDDGMEGVDILTSIGVSQEMADKLWEFTGYFIEFYNNVKEQIDKVKTVFEGIFDIFKGDHTSANELLRSVGLSEETIDMIFETVAKVQGAFEDVKDKIGEALSAVGDFFIEQFENIKNWWDSDGTMIFDAMGTVVEETFNAIQDAIDFGLKFAVSLFETFAPIVEGIWNTLWPTIEFIAKNTWNTIETTIGVAMDLIQGIISGVSAIIEGDWDEFGQILSDTTESIKERVVEFFGNMKDNAIELVNDLTGGAVDKFIEMRDGVIEWVKDLIENVYFWWERLKRDAELKVREMVHNVQQFFSDLWENVTTKASEIKDGVVNRFTELKDNTVERITELYNSVTGWFSDLWTGVTGWASDIKDDVVGYFTGLKEDSIARVTEAYESITGWFSDMWTSVTGTASDLKDDVSSAFSTMKDNTIGRAEDAFDGVTGWFGDMWSNTKETASSLRDDVTERFGNMKDNAIGRAEDMWSGVTGWFGDTLSDTVSDAGSIRDDVSDRFGTMKDNAVEAAKAMWSGTTDWFDDIKEDAESLFSNMVEGAKKLPGRIGDAIKDMASFAVDGAKAMGNRLADGLESVVNGVVGGLNSLLNKIGMDDPIPEINIDRFSTGTGGSSDVGAGGNFRTFSTGTRNGRIAEDMLGILNDRGPGNGRGGAVQELVERNGTLLVPQGKDALVPLKQGDRIYNGAEVQSMQSAGMLPRFSRGTGTEGGNSGTESKGLFSRLGDIVSNVWDFITEPKKAFEAVLDSVTGTFDGLKGFAGKFASGAFNLVKEHGLNYLTDMFSKSGGIGTGEAVPFMNYRMTTPYSPNAPVPGYPRNFNNGHHYGIDYATPVGTPIHAPTGGKLSSFWNTGGGLIAKLVTGQLRQFFMHMSSVESAGSVQAGQVLGHSGNSGKWTTGAHLHWQAQQGTDSLNVGTIHPHKVINGYANGDIVFDHQVAQISEEGPEAIIPLSVQKRGRANHLHDIAGRMLGMDKSDQDNKRMIENQQRQIDRLDIAINVLMGIEDKTGFTDNDIGKSNDRYQGRGNNLRQVTTGRMKYDV